MNPLLHNIAIVVSALLFLLPGEASAERPGALVMVGGGLADDNVPVWSTIVAEAGGPGAIIVIVPAASADPERSGAAAAAALAMHGATPLIAPLAVEVTGAFGPSTAHDERWASRMEAAGGVYLTGGAQERLVSALKPGGEESAFLRAIRQMHARGGSIAGSSAGAAVMSSIMFTDPANPSDLLLRGAQVPDDVGPGLGFLGFGWMVDQHFLARARFERAFPAMCATRTTRLVGIDEDTALVVHGDMATVVGRSGVVVMTVRPRRACAPLPPMSARVHVLFDGDRLDLRTGRATPAPNGAVPVADPRVANIVSSAVSGGLASAQEAEGRRWTFAFHHVRSTRVTDGQTVTDARLSVKAHRASR